MVHWHITMHNAPHRGLAAKGCLVWILAFALTVLPVYADGQAQPQQPAPAPSPVPPPATPPAQQTPAAPRAQPMAPLPVVKDLKIMVLAGNNEMNDLERKVMAPLVVQVLDQNDRPVQGAEVVFRFPPNGPGATFHGGNTSQTVRTNGTGEAAAMNWMANNQVGTFDVHINAAYGNEVGEVTARMSNVTRVVQGSRIGTSETAAEAKTHWYSSKWVKIAIIGGAAGVAAGIALAFRGGSHPSSSPPITITPGPPSVGGPH